MRVAIGIDPGDKSGVALWSLGGSLVTENGCTEHGFGLLHAECVSIRRAAWSEVKAVGLLGELLGSASWIGAVERPWGNIRGRQHARTAPPTYAERHWRQVLELLARYRCEQAGVRYRAPIILRPRPGDWRSRLGISTHGIGNTDEGRTAFLKLAAISRLAIEGYSVPQSDAAEAGCIAFWAARTAQGPLVRESARAKPVEIRWAA